MAVNYTGAVALAEQILPVLAEGVLAEGSPADILCSSAMTLCRMPTSDQRCVQNTSSRLLMSQVLWVPLQAVALSMCPAASPICRPCLAPHTGRGSKRQTAWMRCVPSASTLRMRGAKRLRLQKGQHAGRGCRCTGVAFASRLQQAYLHFAMPWSVQSTAASTVGCHAKCNERRLVVATPVLKCVALSMQDQQGHAEQGELVHTQRAGGCRLFCKIDSAMHTTHAADDEYVS